MDGWFRRSGFLLGFVTTFQGLLLLNFGRVASWNFRGVFFFQVPKIVQKNPYFHKSQRFSCWVRNVQKKKLLRIFCTNITFCAGLTPSTEGKDAASSRSTSRMKAPVTIGVGDRYSARPNVVTSVIANPPCGLKMCVTKNL